MMGLAPPSGSTLGPSRVNTSSREVSGNPCAPVLFGWLPFVVVVMA